MIATLLILAALVVLVALDASDGNEPPRDDDDAVPRTQPPETGIVRAASFRLASQAIGPDGS